MTKLNFKIIRNFQEFLSTMFIPNYNSCEIKINACLWLLGNTPTFSQKFKFNSMNIKFFTEMFMADFSNGVTDTAIKFRKPGLMTRQIVSIWWLQINSSSNFLRSWRSIKKNHLYIHDTHTVMSNMKSLMICVNKNIFHRSLPLNNNWSVTCDRSMVFSGFSGFLHQWNWPPLI